MLIYQMHFTLDGYPSLEKYRIIHSNPTKINLVEHASNQKTKNQIWCLSIIFKKKNLCFAKHNAM